MRVFDGFTFFNELDLLEVRLVELDPVVDAFILVEATQTFRGATKPLHFAENAGRFARWRHKIRHIVVRDFGDLRRARQLHPTKRPSNDNWAREWLQRDAIRQGLNDAAPRDLVIVSDVDEVPRREAIARLRDDPRRAGCVAYFQQAHHVNFLDWRRDGGPWVGSRALERRRLRSPQALRLTHFEGNAHTWAPMRRIELSARTLRLFGALLNPTPVPEGGWHFTSMGGPAAVTAKIAAFSEDIGPPEAWTEAAVRARFTRGESHDGAPIQRAADAELPHALRDDPARYAHLTSASLARMEQQDG